MMNMDWFDEYLLNKSGVTKDYKVEWEWNRYMVGGKMFAATCCPGDKYAVEYANHPLITLKCDPMESELLRGQHQDILVGFYMDKRNWISIRLDGEVPIEVLQQCCDTAYQLAFSKLTKKLQKEIAEK